MQTKKMPFLSVCVRDRLNSGTGRHGGGESKEENGELALYSPLKVIFFVALMCGMLVLMYFFYNILGEWNPKTPLLCFKVITSHVLLISLVSFFVFCFFTQFTSLSVYSAWHLPLHCSAVLMR